MFIERQNLPKCGAKGFDRSGAPVGRGEGCPIPPLPPEYARVRSLRAKIINLAGFRHEVRRNVFETFPGLDAGTICGVMGLTESDLDRLQVINRFYHDLEKKTRGKRHG